MSNQTPSDKDPASRLAEMLAQSLDELARPASDKPLRLAEPPAPADSAANAAVVDIVPKDKLPKAGPAPELEAWFEQFQKKVQSEPVVFPKPAEPPRAEAEPAEPEPEAVRPAEPKFDLDGHVMAALPVAPPPPPAANDDEGLPAAAPAAAAPVMPAATAAGPAEASLDAEAARVVRKVRRLMMVSMLITLIGVGSVFGIIGYRVYKNDGAGGKLFGTAAPAAPEAPASAAPAAAPLEKTLRLPANARVLSAGVAEGLLAVTIALDGKVEVRTFDLQTLEPAARMGFATAP